VKTIEKQSLKTEEIKKEQCDFCSQAKATFQVCPTCRDELLEFQNLEAIYLHPKQYKQFMKTFKFMYNSFLGYLEEYMSYEGNNDISEQ
jgi:hypothetical protein